MPRLPGIGQKDAVRVLAKRGFRVVRQGKHITLSNGAVMVQAPRHTVINAYTMGYTKRPQLFDYCHREVREARRGDPAPRPAPGLECFDFAHHPEQVERACRNGWIASSLRSSQ